MAGTPGSERTIGQLVADATHDFQGLVRSEIALASVGPRAFGYDFDFVPTGISADAPAVPHYQEAG